MDGATLALTGDVAAGSGCSVAGSEVRCGAGVTRVRMHLGGGDDSAAARRLFVICFPICPPPRGPLDVPLEFDGGPGDDSVMGGDGNDVLAGGAGRDTFRLTPFGAADGADVVSGGDGIDEADYSLASPRVVVTLDDAAGDGVDGENDDVRADVEDVIGTSGDDVLAGDADANQLSGAAGSDDLTGGGGFDALYGGDGVDLLRARDGNPERVDCGADNDFAVVDAFDRVCGCESLDVSAALQADLDHDGFSAPADCDDSDPAVRPGVADAPDNGLDENCDGADATIADRDGDGIRAPADCDDANAAIRPGAAEIFANAVDENCDGVAAPLQTIESTVQSAFQAARSSTRVRRLRITQVRARHHRPRRMPGLGQTPRVPARRHHGAGRARYEAAGPAQAARPAHAASADEQPDRAVAATARLARAAGDVPVPQPAHAVDRRALRPTGLEARQPLPDD